MQKVTAVLSDLHGNLDMFESILYEITNSGVIIEEYIYLGDLIDRGDSTKEILDEIIEQKKKARVHVLFGNHEFMMWMFIKNRDLHNGRLWFRNGGYDTIVSIMGENARNIPRDPEFVLRNFWHDLLEAFSPYIEELWPRPHEQLWLVKRYGEKTFLFSHGTGTTESWRKVLNAEDLTYKERLSFIQLDQRADTIELPENHVLVFGHHDRKQKVIGNTINLCSNDPEKGLCLLIDRNGDYEFREVEV